MDHHFERLLGFSDFDILFDFHPHLVLKELDFLFSVGLHYIIMDLMHPYELELIAGRKLG